MCRNPSAILQGQELDKIQNSEKFHFMEESISNNYDWQIETRWGQETSIVPLASQ